MENPLITQIAVLPCNPAAYWRVWKHNERNRYGPSSVYIHIESPTSCAKARSVVGTLHLPSVDEFRKEGVKRSLVVLAALRKRYARIAPLATGRARTTEHDGGFPGGSNYVYGTYVRRVDWGLKTCLLCMMVLRVEDGIENGLGQISILGRGLIGGNPAPYGEGQHIDSCWLHCCRTKLQSAANIYNTYSNGPSSILRRIARRQGG